jgi:hypothetical protein
VAIGNRRLRRGGLSNGILAVGKNDGPGKTIMLKQGEQLNEGAPKGEKFSEIVRIVASGKEDIEHSVRVTEEQSSSSTTRPRVRAGRAVGVTERTIRVSESQNIIMGCDGGVSGDVIGRREFALATPTTQEDRISNVEYTSTKPIFSERETSRQCGFAEGPDREVEGEGGECCDGRGATQEGGGQGGWRGRVQRGRPSEKSDRGGGRGERERTKERGANGGDDRAFPVDVRDRILAEVAIETFRHTICSYSLHVTHAAGRGESVVDESKVMKGEEGGAAKEMLLMMEGRVSGAGKGEGPMALADSMKCEASA